MKYDKEEKYILDVLENGNIVLSTPSKEEIEAIKEAANNTFKKDCIAEKNKDLLLNSI